MVAIASVGGAPLRCRVDGVLWASTDSARPLFLQRSVENYEIRNQCTCFDTLSMPVAAVNRARGRRMALVGFCDRQKTAF